MNPILDAALMWAEEGVPVFPVLGKEPLTKHGFKDAVTDAEQIRTWLTGRPERGIGASTGEPCGAWVLDVDGPHGRAQLARLVEHHGALPATRRTKTRNGVHYWFAMPEGREIRIGTKLLGAHPAIAALTKRWRDERDEAAKAALKAEIAREDKRIGGGIDLRGTGGYVVLPPSPHPEGGCYELVDDTPVAAAPDWLLELVTASKRRRRELCPWLEPSAPPPATPSKPSDTTARLWAQSERTTPGERARARVLGMVREAVDAITGAVQGTRQTVCNDKCFAIGGFLDEARVLVDEVAPELEAAARAAEQNPEVVRRALEKGRQAPRPLPPDEGPPSGGGGPPPPSRPDAPNTPRRTGRPQIVLGPRISLTLDRAIAALAQHPEVYCRGTELVTVRQDRIRPLTRHSLLICLDQAADFVKVKFSDGERKLTKVPPPTALADQVRDWGRYPEVRELVGITTSPVLRPDGTIVTTPGYDRETGLIFEPTEPLPDLPDRPTLDDAKRAIERLLDVVSEVKFERPADASAWLSLVLTLVARHVIKANTPLFAAFANQARVGKTNLIRYASLIATGQSAPPTRWPTGGDEEELAKRIESAVYHQLALLLLDNVNTEIQGTVLDQVLTSEIITLRLLRTNDMPSVLRQTVLAVSMNGGIFGGDTALRALPIRLYEPNPNPERRTFRRPDLFAYIREHRSELHAAALTIVSAFLQAGSPNQGLPTWGSYETWSSIIRQSLVWAGQPDPFEAREGIEQIDTNASAHDRLVAFVSSSMVGDFTAGELADAMSSGDLMSGWDARDARDLACDLGCWSWKDHTVNRRALGKLLVRRLDRPSQDGARITRAKGLDGTPRIHRMTKVAMYRLA